VSLGPRAPFIERSPFFQLGAWGPIKIKDSTSAPGAEDEIVFNNSFCINLICVAHADDEL
jgi:hypothetical protein